MLVSLVPLHAVAAVERVTVEIGADGGGELWLDKGADAWVLPVSGGVLIDADDAELVRWMHEGGPFSLSELPAFGARHGDDITVMIVPWPQYAELVVEDGAVGVRFEFPPDRLDATPSTVVIDRRPWSELAVADAFRQWRATADDLGGIPAKSTLREKVAAQPNVERLAGAAHIYLWRPSLFSRHDVDRRDWIAFAKAIETDESLAELRGALNEEERAAVEALASAEFPGDYLTLPVAAAIERFLAAGGSFSSELTHDPATWGDGLSLTLLDALVDAGIDRAVLLQADLAEETPRPDVAERAETLGFLLGRYDSYHSVHDPDATETWETAQFDEAAYTDGRVINADGTGHAGFKGRGYHLAPEFAFPYVKARVDGILNEMPQTAWFIDCDATAEVFDDYNPLHPATRAEDVAHRRERLKWLAEQRDLVVGSEGGSVLFADVIAFGHGVHTPYIGHLDPAFRDPESPSFVGRYWPPDTPAINFKSIVVPPALMRPYFDPTVRIPLYQAALGDELVTTYHWGFDSLKLDDVNARRALWEMLYMIPPMYHVNRDTFEQRRAEIVRRHAFWSPLHQRLWGAPLVAFEAVSEDRLVQRATYRTDNGDVTITANFAEEARDGLPTLSVEVVGTDGAAARWSAVPTVPE